VSNGHFSRGTQVTNSRRAVQLLARQGLGPDCMPNGTVDNRFKVTDVRKSKPTKQEKDTIEQNEEN
jgi:hypothetical protein